MITLRKSCVAAIVLLLVTNTSVAISHIPDSFQEHSLILPKRNDESNVKIKLTAVNNRPVSCNTPTYRASLVTCAMGQQNCYILHVNRTSLLAGVAPCPESLNSRTEVEVVKLIPYDSRKPLTIFSSPGFFPEYTILSTANVRAK